MTLHQMIQLREQAVLRALILTLDADPALEATLSQVAATTAANWDRHNLTLILGAEAAAQLLATPLQVKNGPDAD